MEYKLCETKHERVNERLETQERRLDNHSTRLDKLEYSNGRLEERLEGLINQLSALTTTMKWFIGLMVASFVAFFFAMVQRGILK